MDLCKLEVAFGSEVKGISVLASLDGSILTPWRTTKKVSKPNAALMTICTQKETYSFSHNSYLVILVLVIKTYRTNCNVFVGFDF